MASQIKTPISVHRTTAHLTITTEALWVYHQWNEWLDNTARLYYIPNISTHPPGMIFQEKCGFGLTTSTPVSDDSTPAYTNGIWSRLWPESVAQKNKLSTMLS